jgi:hypothetical protein
MRYLPTDEDQEWLLRELAELIRVRGIDTFVASPIVRPTSEFFPDPVDSPGAALDRITRRLLQYAGLGGLDMHVELFEHGEVEETRDGTRCRSIAGCFLGIENGCCHFGINVEAASDVEHLAGVMAHEVAHAYRAHHPLRSTEGDEEELRTDVTTAYLGFGVLATNNSYRFRKSGSLVGNMAYTSWSTSSAGYLPPQAHGFLLGAQVAVRCLDRSERRAIYRELEANQAAFVKAAVKIFESEEIVLEKALGLPPRANWPRPLAVGDVLRPLSRYSPREDTSQQRGVEAESGWNRGRPVFRITDSRTLLYAVSDSAVLGALGLILSTLLFHSWLGLVPFAVAGVVSGVRRGRRTRMDLCSDAGCRTTLAPSLTRCPNCAGEIMGRLDHEDERLAMEERFREAARERRQKDA